jgi:hypothetical protein
VLPGVHRAISVGHDVLTLRRRVIDGSHRVQLQSGNELKQQVSIFQRHWGLYVVVDVAKLDEQKHHPTDDEQI